MPLQSRSQFNQVDVPIRYITEAGPAEQLCQELMRQPLAAWDTETVGHNVKKESPVGKARCVLFSVCFNEDEAFAVKNYGNQEGMIKIFKPWFESERCQKLTHNGKYDNHVMENHGIKVRGNVFDSVIGTWLLDENLPKALEEQVLHHFSEKYPTFSQTFRYRPLVKSGKRRMKAYKTADLTEVLLDPSSPLHQPVKAAKYAGKDAWLQYRLGLYVRDSLTQVQWYRDYSMLDYYNKVEHPYQDALYDMERVGTRIDIGYLGELSEMWVKEMEECRIEFMERAVEMGAPQSVLRELNMGSSQQLAELFYGMLEMPAGRQTKKGFSVDDAELERLENAGFDIVTSLRRINSLEKLRGTYSDTLPLQADKDGRVHTSFNQTGTVTGRLSSSNPNLQNIPIRSADGALIREAFIPTDGYKMIDSDLSQIELRLMAHMSQDGRMIEGFNSGEDFHALTAKGMYPQLADKSVKEIKKHHSEERGRGKTLNFGIQYGMGPGKLSKDWGVSMDEARKILQSYHRTYPNIGTFKRHSLMFARTNGFVRTLLRRYRHLHNINSSDKIARSYAEREAISSIIQGSAADILKMAMILVHRDERLKKMGYRMLIQVHDEILGEAPMRQAVKAQKIVEGYMENPYKHFGMKPLCIPTPAEGSAAMCWAEAH